MLTPLTPGLEVDAHATASLVEFLIDAGVDGLFALGSTGEGDSLPPAVQYEFGELVAAQAAGRVPLYLGAMQAGTELAVDFLRGCPNLDAFDAVVVGVPYYRFLRCDSEVITHFRRVHEETERPVIVYNLPHPASRVLSRDMLLKLARTDGVIGYKDSSGRLDSFQELVSAGMNQDGFRMYQGDPALCLASLAIGGDGVIAGTANFIPWVLVELHRAFRAHDTATAAALQAEVLRFRLFARIPTPFTGGGFHFSTFKAGLEVMGFGGATPAPPLAALPERSLGRLRRYFEASDVISRARPYVRVAEGTPAAMRTADETELGTPSRFQPERVEREPAP